MKFHTYQTWFDLRVPDDLKLNYREFYRLWSSAADLDEVAKTTSLAEFIWLENRKPYYHVFPAITDMLTGVTLDVDCDFLKVPYNPLAIQFAEGKEPSGIRSLLAFVNSDNQSRYLTINVNYVGREKGSTHFKIEPGKTIEQKLVTLANNKGELDQPNPSDWEHTKVALRIVLALCLLDNDPELILPDVLTADKLKWEGGDEALKAKLEQRAKQRGKFGWLVGAGVEVVPHIRRPHLGLRWTGPGRKIPKIVPIKWAIVHRKQITDFPTGFGEDGLTT